MEKEKKEMKIEGGAVDTAVESKKKELRLPLTVSEDMFVTEDGEKIKYFSYRLKIGDEIFKLTPKPDDKRMLNYLLREMIDNVVG